MTVKRNPLARSYSVHAVIHALCLKCGLCASRRRSARYSTVGSSPRARKRCSAETWGCWRAETCVNGSALAAKTVTMNRKCWDRVLQMIDRTAAGRLSAGGAELRRADTLRVYGFVFVDG